MPRSKSRIKHEWKNLLCNTKPKMEDPTALVELLDAFDAGEYFKVVKDASTLLPKSLYWHALVETKDYELAMRVSETPQQKLYVDYQRQQYKTILKSSNDDTPFVQALLAQSFFHLGDYAKASDAFFRLARSTDDTVEAMRAWTNGIACWTADATKTKLSKAEEVTITEILHFLEAYDEDESPYELQYTLASFLMCVQPSVRWMKLLESAKASCQEDADDLDLIETNLSYVYGTKQDAAKDHPVRLANVNPMALEKPPKEWTPRQRLTLLYNQALAKKQKGKDYSKECKELETKTPFWQVRALMLENNHTSLEEFIRKSDDPEAILFTTFYLAHQQNDPLAYLRDHLPKHILDQPAMQATYQSSENMVEVYEKNKNVDEASFARWVRALAQCDPARALTEWKNHAATIDMPFLDPEELEARERPRSLPMLARSPVSNDSTTMVTNNGGAKKKKSRDAILRYRAKKRAEYLEQKGIPPHRTPNPNRWVSQKQSAQGAVGVSSTKYDVANRQASANSTAHLGVKGKDRKGKRR